MNQLAAAAPIISIEDLCFSYGENEILSAASLKVSRGEYVALIGPNGGGKTTLLRLLMGLLSADSGKILIAGKRPKKARKRIGYVPQNLRYDRLFPITVLELVLGGTVAQSRWWGPYRRSDKEKAMAALEKVGLAKHANKSFGNLSGGQAQRALIARALASSPDILILDEPTANVDMEAESEILTLVKGLQGLHTILMVTHDLQVVIEDVDRVLIVQREIKSVPPKEVCKHFAVGLYHRPLIDKQAK